ncbi:hypothetical protein C8J56DRAFT_1172807 [Mycena floridula]|nr:hypothetical protein C8J56DRAFT_1172807 [Mycena floridula]
MEIPQIPQDFIDTALLLPSAMLTIPELIAFRTPPVSPNEIYAHLNDDALFSVQPSSFNPQTISIILSLPFPSEKELQGLYIRIQKAVASGKKSICHISAHTSDREVRLPLWSFGWWSNLHFVIAAQAMWIRAFASVKETRKNSPVIEAACQVLQVLPWNTPIPRNFGGTTSMSALFTNQWLNDDVLSQIAGQLSFATRNMMTFDKPPLILDPYWSGTLLQSYRLCRNSYSTNGHQCLRDAGQALVGGEWAELAFPLNVLLENGVVKLPSETQGILGNHWIIIVIDPTHSDILIGDPAASRLPDSMLEVVDCIRWWLGCHYGPDELFDVIPMPISRQRDSYSCGVLAMDSISHRYLGTDLSDPYQVDVLRAKNFIGIVRLLKLAPVPSLESLTNQPKAALTPSHRPLKDTKTGAKATVKSQTMKAVSGAQQKRDNIANDIKTMTSNIGVKRKTAEVRNSDDSKSDDESDSEIVEEDCVDAESNLVRVAPKHKKNEITGKNAGGRPKLKILDQLLVEVYDKTKGVNSKTLWQCSGDVGGQCPVYWSNRPKKRVLKHAMFACRRLPADLKKTAIEEGRKDAPSKRVKDAEDKAGRKKMKLDVTGATPEVNRAEEAKESAKHPFFVQAQAMGKEIRSAKLDLLYVKVFSIAGLPTALAQRPIWREFMSTMEPRWNNPTREKLENDLIPSEAAECKTRQLLYLSQQSNLTISGDGGTTTGKAAFWCAHVSTDGVEGDRKSGSVIFFIGQIRNIGVHRFAAICTDSTGNTKGSRGHVIDEFPVILDFGDTSHHTNSLLKDLVKLKHFAPTIKISRETITFYTKSHIAISELEKARELHKIGRGLESIGATRFGTIIHSLNSIKRCLPAISQTVIWGRVNESFNFYECFDSSDSMSPAAFNYKFGLNQLILLGLPAAKALACLEAHETTLADVYLFWHAFIALMHETIQDPRNRVPAEVADTVYGIIEFRFAQMFTSGHLGRNSLAYLSATFLNPGLLRSDIFNKDTDESPSLSGVHNVSVYKRVAQYLYGLVTTEIQHGGHEHFTRWRGHADLFNEVFKREILAFARQQEPFNAPIDESKENAVLRWWASIATLKRAEILPYIAIKLYSIRVGSIPDEQLGSRFTWMTPKVRANLSVPSLTATAIINQHYAEKRKAASRPALRFHNLKKKFYRIGTGNEPAELNDVEGDSWLDEAETADPIPPRPFSASTFRIDSPLNLKSSRITELLADTVAMDSEEQSAKLDVSSIIGRDTGENNDFSLSFL